jgi:hypothetical protein
MELSGICPDLPTLEETSKDLERNGTLSPKMSTSKAAQPLAVPGPVSGFSQNVIGPEFSLHASFSFC